MVNPASNRKYFDTTLVSINFGNCLVSSGIDYSVIGSRPPLFLCLEYILLFCVLRVVLKRKCRSNANLYYIDTGYINTTQLSTNERSEFTNAILYSMTKCAVIVFS